MWIHYHSPTWKGRAFGDDALNPFTIISAVTERDIRYNWSRSCCDPEVLRCFVDPKNSKRPWVKSQIGFHSIAGAWWWFPKKNEPSLTRRVGKGREVFTIIYPDLLPFSPSWWFYNLQSCISRWFSLENSISTKMPNVRWPEGIFHRRHHHHHQYQ
jgi:hypothetical protein